MMSPFKGIALYCDQELAIDEPGTDMQLEVKYIWEIPEGHEPTREEVIEKFAHQGMAAVFIYLTWN